MGSSVAVRVAGLYVSVAEISAPDGPRTLNVCGVRVAEFIGSLNVAETLAARLTPVAPAAGAVAMTEGAVVSGATLV